MEEVAESEDDNSGREPGAALGVESSLGVSGRLDSKSGTSGGGDAASM